MTDPIPHPGTPRPETQPDRLATLASLFGISPAPVERCRVLDIGCSDGANLISTALALPECELVGIDLSEGQVAEGRAAAAALGLENVRLEVGDLLSLPDLGEFDYVIAYGMLSWVPLEVRAALLRAVRACLAPQGVAYLNSNTYPGWRFAGAIREAMLFRSDPRDRGARLARGRAVLQFLAAAAPDDDPVYQTILRGEWQAAQGLPDHALEWDILCADNNPLYYHELDRLLTDHDLRYVTDVNLPDSLPQNHLAPDALQGLQALAPDRVAREQYLDFLVNRSHRRSVVCRADVELDRRLTIGRLAGLSVASAAVTAEAEPDLRSDASVTFKGPKRGELATRHPLAKGMLAYLATRWPVWVPVAELASHARAWFEARGGAPPVGPHDAEILAEHVLVGYSRGVLELHAGPVPFALEPGERPRASPLARRALALGQRTFNLRHERVRLEPELCALLPLLDGTRDRAALLAELPDVTPDALEGSLREVAVRALLMPRG